MIGLNNNSVVEESVECPLCMEPLEVDDLHFYPCTCGYQICRFCWHRIRTDENELCPACRKEYPENPADFTPLTQEEMIAFKSQKKQRDQQRKQKITENRKHLANVRVVQKNLVFVVGLPPRLADADILKKHEYFGKYGKIHKVVINPSTTYAGVQGPSASAYVTYVHSCDALRAIQSVNNIMIDGRLVKTSLGTTKYCSHFMKNQQCPKNDCMYLHELGDPEASFTKEEMHQGKHQEYEKRLHDTLISTSGGSVPAQVTSTSAISGIISVSGTSNVLLPNQTNKTYDGKSLMVTGTVMSSVSSPTTQVTESLTNVQQREAWPSLCVSPIKEISGGNVLKSKKDKFRNERVKNERTPKVRTKNNDNAPSSTLSTLHTSRSKETNNCLLTSRTEIVDILTFNCQSETYNKSKNKEKIETEKPVNQRKDEENQNPTKEKRIIGVDEEVKLIEDTEYKTRSNENHSFDQNINNTLLQTGERRSQSSSSNNSSNSNNSDSVSSFSESSTASGKGFPGNLLAIITNEEAKCEKLNLTKHEDIDNDFIIKKQDKENIASSNPGNNNFMHNMNFSIQDERPTDSNVQLSEHSNVSEAKGAFSKLLLTEDNNSFFSTSVQTSLSKHKTDDKSNINIVGQSQLPDLLNDKSVPDYLNNLNSKALPSHNLEEAVTHHQRQTESAATSSNILVGTNMSKFFDFHKIQQQQHLQQSLAMTGHAVKNPLVLTSLLDDSRINSQIGDQANGYKTHQQQQMHKPRIYNRMDIKPSFGQQSRQFEDTQPNRFSRPYPLTGAAEDELGFDPFIETQKGFAELMESEIIQQNSINRLNITGTKSNQHVLNNTQRTQMPPPGFNHVNTFGVGLTRGGSDNLPFVDASGNGTSKNPHQIPQLEQIGMLSTWNPHFSPFGPRSLNDQNMRQYNHAHNLNNGSNYKGYNTEDWTVMDPAILSFRQFSSYPQQSQIVHRPQQQDLFLQQLTHQQTQNIAAPSSQAHIQGTTNMPNNVLNTQISSAQVNTNVQGMLEFLKSRQFV